MWVRVLPGVPDESKMKKPTKEEFATYIDHVEYNLPLLEKTILAQQKLGGKNKWNERSLKNLETIKRVSQWLQEEFLDEFYIRYKD